MLAQQRGHWRFLEFSYSNRIPIFWRLYIPLFRHPVEIRSPVLLFIPISFREILELPRKKIIFWIDL
jgi:hypothetical protein